MKVLKEKSNWNHLRFSDFVLWWTTQKTSLLYSTDFKRYTFLHSRLPLVSYGVKNFQKGRKGFFGYYYYFNFQGCEASPTVSHLRAEAAKHIYEYLRSMRIEKLIFPYIFLWLEKIEIKELKPLNFFYTQLSTT